MLESTLWQPAVEGRFSSASAECWPSAKGPVSTGSLQSSRGLMQGSTDTGRDVGCFRSSVMSILFCPLSQKLEEGADIMSPICAFVASGTRQVLGQCAQREEVTGPMASSHPAVARVWMTKHSPLYFLLFYFIMLRTQHDISFNTFLSVQHSIINQAQCCTADLQNLLV